jgi:hypothetical protein
MQDFHFPGQPRRFFETYDGYQDALQREVNGSAYTKYDLYEWRQTTVGMTLERDLLGGIVRPLVGLRLRCTAIHDFTGDRVDAEDSSGHCVRAIEQPTRMHTDCLAGVITGCDGGFENLLTLGVSVDTLDFEPDPYAGLLAQAVAEFSRKALGSDFEYERLTSSISAYRMLFPNWRGWCWRAAACTRCSSTTSPSSACRRWRSTRAITAGSAGSTPCAASLINASSAIRPCW